VKYFSFTVYENEAMVMISMTPLSDHHPVMVASFGADSRPSPGNADFSIKTLEGTSIIINKEASKVVANSMQGTYM